jgi:hypothetical protein
MRTIRGDSGRTRITSGGTTGAECTWGFPAFELAENSAYTTRYIYFSLDWGNVKGKRNYLNSLILPKILPLDMQALISATWLVGRPTVFSPPRPQS